MKSTLFLLVFLSNLLILSFEVNSRTIKYEDIKIVHSSKDASNFCLFNECTSTLVGFDTKGVIYLINYLSNVNPLPSKAYARPLKIESTLSKVITFCDVVTTYCTKVLNNDDSYEITYYEALDGSPEPKPKDPDDHL